MEKCPNCSNEFTKSYCNNCGQKIIKGDLTIKMVLSDFVQNVFLFDSTLYKTLIGLLINPGRLVKSYLGGKKKKYLQPFQFFLLFMTIYLLVLNFFGDTFFDFINSGLQIESDKISKAELIQTLVRKNLNVLYFILTPIIAFFIHIFYKKTKFNYAEMLIFSLYIFGVALLLSSVVIIIGQFSPKLFVLKSIITLGYIPFAITQFTNSKSLLGVVKALMTIILSYLTFAFLILVFVSIYVYIFMI
ncbi:MAG: DUF3667 domain-containing protein [Bacteroidetes bacterium]|nr:DUF3667 domain-containing protein [Bacteroidota bacterium]